MTVCALCSELVCEASVQTDWCIDVLWKFVQTNDFKLAVDRKKRLYDQYLNLARERNDRKALKGIADWLKIVSRRTGLAVEYVDVDLDDSDRKRSLFLIANCIIGDRLCIIWAKQDHDQEEISKCGAPVVDRHEALMRFREHKAGGKTMLDVVAAGQAISAIAGTLGVVDKVYSMFMKFRQTGEIENDGKVLQSQHTELISVDNNGTRAPDSQLESRGF